MSLIPISYTFHVRNLHMSISVRIRKKKYRSCLTGLTTRRCLVLTFMSICEICARPATTVELPSTLAIGHRNDLRDWFLKPGWRSRAAWRRNGSCKQSWITLKDSARSNIPNRSGLQSTVVGASAGVWRSWRCCALPWSIAIAFL